MERPLKRLRAPNLLNMGVCWNRGGPSIDPLWGRNIDQNPVFFGFHVGFGDWLGAKVRHPVKFAAFPASEQHPKPKPRVDSL